MKLSQDLYVGEKVYEKGSECPKSEELRLLLHNRDYLELEYKDGLPVVPKEYASYFVVPKSSMKIPETKYSQENLTQKLNELKTKEFKEWAEKEFGADKIDRRKTAKSIIVEILRMQEESKR